MLRGLVIGSVIVGALIFSFSESEAAGSAPIGVSATILSNNNCKVRNPQPSDLDFGLLDPAAPGPPNVTRNTILKIRCQGKDPTVTFFASHDGGTNPLGPLNQMEHTGMPGVFLPYSLTLTPASATIPKGLEFDILVEGTVLGVDYFTAPVGPYLDPNVTLSINP
jgi:hypothetical protein